MKARNFRYIFENTNDGIVLSGGIWDTLREQKTNFSYVCGIRNERKKDRKNYMTQFRFEQTMEPCHIFVLASFSIRYVESMLKMVRQDRMETVILPYVIPQQRQMMLKWYEEEINIEPEFGEFLEHPYSYLKNAGVKNVYLLYGNGEVWHGEEKGLTEGHYFELLDQGELQIIEEMEGRYIPVVKAGYIIENKWLFYFGHFGREINLHEQSDDIIFSSITMFQGPLYTNSNETDSVMNGKVVTKERKCIPYFQKKQKNCMLRCIYEEDYAIYRRHKQKDCTCGCFGTFTIGNVNMGRYLQEISARFQNVLVQVRAITVPGCGNSRYWDRQCLTLIFGEGIKYWICGLDHTTSPNVISDITVAGPQNRFVTISEEFGYCFSGYLVPRAEESL